MLRYVGSLDVDSALEYYESPTIVQYWERREAAAAVHCVPATIPYVHLTILRNSEMGLLIKKRFVYGIDVTREQMQIER